MAAFYNEIDPFAADWLENLIKEGLIPDGKVDRRSIVEITPEDVRGFDQQHYFAGIGGWALALRLAGWPDDRPVGTGSCPCQPYSAAGKQEGDDDPRNLWPIMFPLVRESGIDTWFGEQVASAIRHSWLDGICANLEGAGYAVGHAVFGAHSAGSPHIRQRLYWVANSCDSERGWRGEPGREHGGALHVADRCGNGGLADTTGRTGPEHEREPRNGSRRESGPHDSAVSGGTADGMAVAEVAARGPGNVGHSGFSGIWRNGPAIGGTVQRMADDNGQRFSRRTESDGIEERPRQPASRRSDAGGRRDSDGMGNSDEPRTDIRAAGSGSRDSTGEPGSDLPAVCPMCCGPAIAAGIARAGTIGSGCSQFGSGLGQSFQSRLEGHSGHEPDRDQSRRFAAVANGSVASPGAWSDFGVVHCTDGKSRRIGRGVFPLAHGVPKKLGRVLAEMEGMGFSAAEIKRRLRNPRSILAMASSNRVGRLKGYGNAIVVQDAAAWVRAFMEISDNPV